MSEAGPETSMRMAAENLKIIDYEEFCPDKPPTSTRRRHLDNSEYEADIPSGKEQSEPIDSQTWHPNSEEEVPIKPEESLTNNSINDFVQWRDSVNSVGLSGGQVTDRSEQCNTTHTGSHMKFLFGPPVEPQLIPSRNSIRRGSIQKSNASGSAKRRRDCCELPLQEPQNRYGSDHSTSLQEFSRGIPSITVPPSQRH